MILQNNLENKIRLATEDDVPKLRLLVNEAYHELAEMGLNFTATFQDESQTRERMQQGRVFLLENGQALVGSVLVKAENWGSGRHSLYISQLAVRPQMKRQRIGSQLIDFCEKIARTENYVSLQLDTAKPAVHLVTWYLKLGFKIIGETHWEGKTYDSWIFEKVLGEPK